MPPLVFDFPAIASRLRKDEFYTPRAKETEEDTKMATPVIPYCPNCGSGRVRSNSFDANLWVCDNCLNSWY